MRSVSVKELKDDPGRYLDEVLAGEEVLIEDQDQLRTGDALQLAAALISCNKNPRRRIFVCFDDRLATFAEDVGFKVIKA